MLKNYLLTTLRNLFRNRVYSLINVLGLAIGLACFFLLVLYIRNELSYENFHENAYRVYRAAPESAARTAPRLAPSMKTYFPEIEKAVRIKRFAGVIQSENQQYFENQLYFAHADIFDLFSFELLEGGGRTVLENPQTIVLTESVAKKYFGNKPAVGQQLTLMDTVHLTVGGVMKDVPNNSHFRPEMLSGFNTFEQLFPVNLDTWQNNIYYTYLLLRENVDVAAFKAKIPTYVSSEILQPTGRESYSLGIQNIKDIHLHSDRRMELEVNSNISYIYIFSSIALIILLIACINFINLTTARASKRAKEIGVRKTIGANYQQLIGQFLGESVITTLLALFFALVLIALGLPLLNDLAEISIRLQDVFALNSIAWMLGIAVLVGLISGIYPAFVLSSFRPYEVLKGRIKTEFNELFLRKSLVVLQFGFSLILIVGTVTAYLQLDYMQNRTLGFAKDQVLVLRYFWDAKVQGNYELLKEKLLNSPAIQEVTRSGDVPGRMATTMSFRTEGMAEDDWQGMNALYIDRDFIPTYGMEMIAGRAFDNNISTDLTNGYILNETAVASLGWHPEEAIGKPFTVHNEGRIIGVVKDFHFNSLHQNVQPLFLANRPSWSGYISLKVNAKQADQAMSALQMHWKEIMVDRPLVHQFLDDDFNRHYLGEQKLSKVVTIFSLLALMIAAVGLFGLATFTCENRSKEIAIRKVFGANIRQVVLLLSKEFTKPVLIACFLALPVAYWLISKWLGQFAYQVALEFWIFPLACIVIFLAAIIAIGLQSFKAAILNPVIAMRNE